MEKNWLDMEHMIYHENYNTVNSKENGFCTGNAITYVQIIASLFKPYAVSFPLLNTVAILSWCYLIKGVLNDLWLLVSE